MTSARPFHRSPSADADGEDHAAAAGEGGGGRGESVGRAYDQLRELIVRGQLAPGSRIVESELADRLGLSRTPIRSALHRLQQEGYVGAVVRAKERRLIVAPLTQSDARELFGIVGQLEGLASRAAAERPAAEREAIASQLRAINVELGAAGRAVKPDPLHMFDLDMAFHRAVVEAGAGPRLQALHDAFKPQTVRYVRLYLSSLFDEIAKSVAEHEAIVDQIAAGDSLAAQRAMDTNWRNAADRLATVIDTHGERGNW